MSQKAGYSLVRKSGLRRIAVAFAFCALFLWPKSGEAQELIAGAMAESDAAKIQAGGVPLAATPIPITYFASTTEKKKNETGAKLWRIAVIGTGSIPFTLFYTNFVFDSIRFAANGFDTQYAPWPFKNQYSAAVSTGETFLRLGVSVGIGAVIGILDTLIQRP